MIKLWKTLSKENVSAAFYFIDDQQSENIMLDFVQSNSRMTYFISLFSDTNLDDILLKVYGPKVAMKIVVLIFLSVDITNRWIPAV